MTMTEKEHQELDGLVAYMVFRQRVVEMDWPIEYVYEEDTRRAWDGDQEALFRYNETGPIFQWDSDNIWSKDYPAGISPVLRYSSDIREAWRVVEKMEKLGYVINLWSDMRNSDTPLWLARFHIGRSGFIGEEDTPMIAICRAAVAALGGK